MYTKDEDKHIHVQVICEGCGHLCLVNNEGECMSPICLKKHGLDKRSE